MPIDCACPHCERTFLVKDHLAGRKTTCPNCKKMFRIPTPPADPGTEQMEPLRSDDAVAELAEDDGTAEEALLVECPLCARRMPFEAKRQGHIITCTHCQRQFRMPTM